MPTSTTVKIIPQEKKREEKIRELLGWKKKNELKALDRAFGILKRLKKSPVAYQRELRKEK